MLKYIFIFFFSSFGLEASPIILKSEKDIYELGLHLDILEDKTKKLSINDVTSSELLPNFKKSTEKVPNFGYSTSAFWIKIIVKNQIAVLGPLLIAHLRINPLQRLFFRKLIPLHKPLTSHFLRYRDPPD